MDSLVLGPIYIFGRRLTDLQSGVHPWPSQVRPGMGRSLVTKWLPSPLPEGGSDGSQGGVRWATLTLQKVSPTRCKGEESIKASNFKIIQENWPHILWRGANTTGQSPKPTRITEHKELHSKACITNTRGLSNRISWDFHSHCNQEGGRVRKFRGSGSWKLGVGKEQQKEKMKSP